MNRLCLPGVVLLTLLLTRFILAQARIVSIDLDKVPTEALRRTLIIDDKGQPLFSTMVNIAADPYEEKLYLGNIDEIIVISLRNNRIERFGRRGQGPGEFRMIWRIAVSDSNIFVADVPNARVHIFNKQFRYIRSIPVNGHLRDVTVVSDDQLLIHTLTSTRSLGLLLHRFDINRPYQPLESFLKVVPKFQGIRANVLTINDLTVASFGDCVYVQYRVLPMQRLFCKDVHTYTELRFTGRAVNRLYEGLGDGIQTSSGAAPAIVFSPRIQSDEDGYLYWLVVPGGDRVFVVKPDAMRPSRSFVLLSESGEYMRDNIDFCVVNGFLYCCNVGNGTIDVYPIKPMNDH